MSQVLRVLPLEWNDGPTNMARDEAVLEAVAKGDSPPTLRLYGWRGRWMSIGLAQRASDVNLDACRVAGVRLLRRSSGGTAVLHEDQLGWSLALPAGHPLAPSDVIESYRRHGSIALTACAALGICAASASPTLARQPLADAALQMACFGGLAPYETIVGEPPRKLIGWGQIRRRGVVLHHAVLSRRFDPCALASLLNCDVPHLTGLLAGQVADVQSAAGRDISLEMIAEAVVAAHASAGFPSIPGAASAEEQARTAALECDHYGDGRWTFRR